MMSNDEKLNQGLRALAEEGPAQAPNSVELMLLREFRKRKTRRAWIRSAVAIAAVFLMVLFAPRPQAIPRPEVRLAHIAVPDIPHPSKPSRVVVRVGKRKAAPAEIASRFYALEDAATLPPFEYGTLVRVQLPRSALRVVGLPVNEDRLAERIDADVLLGQDGLARAVRFIQ